MTSSRWPPVQTLVIATACLVFSPLLLLLSPVLVPAGILWLVRRRQTHFVDEASETSKGQIPQRIHQVHDGTINQECQEQKSSSEDSTRTELAPQSNDAAPLAYDEFTKLRALKPNANGFSQHEGTPANGTAQPQRPAAEISAPLQKPGTGGDSEPQKQDARRVTLPQQPDASSSPKFSTPAANGSAQSQKPAATQQAAAPKTGSAALLARIRAQRDASAKAASSAASQAGKSQEVIVTYASQTGTAQEIARNIQAESSQHGIRSKVLSFNELGFEALTKPGIQKQIVVMIVSSTGEGDPPDNAVRFYGHSKRRSLASDALQHVQFTCLGLGDSNYTRYMAVPRAFKGRFSELGARVFYPHLEADEVDGLEEFVDKWLTGLWSPLKAAADGSSQSEAGSQAAAADGVVNGNAAVAQAGGTASNPPDLSAAASPTPSPNGLTPQAEAEIPRGQTLPQPTGRVGSTPLKGVTPLPECRVKLTWHQDTARASQIRQAEAAHPTQAEEEYRDPERLYSPEQPFWARLTDAQVLTSAESEREVLHMELNVEGSGMAYQPGDSIGVLPHNRADLVQGVLQHLGQEGQQVFSVESSSGDRAVLLQHLHWPCSLERALTVGCDLTSVPRKSLLRLLAEHCSKAGEKQALLQLCSSGGRQAYSSQIKEGQPSLLDLFHHYPSCRPPLDALLDALPPLAPRMYSISSSPLQLPHAVQVAFTVVKYPTPAGTRHGVATTWLQQLCKPLLGKVSKPAEAHIRLPVYLRRGGSFGLPKLGNGVPNLAAPMLLIGPGTGVAPFRGFLQERQHQLQDNKGEVGTTILYFGCRHRDQDYLYQQDLKKLQNSIVLTKLRVAFSREQIEKVYVQHLMQQDAQEVFNVLQHPAVHVYVCGDGSSMAKDVHNALVGILQSKGGMTSGEANAFMTDMTKQHRYVRDIWS